MGLTFNLELNSKPNRFGQYSILIRIHRTGFAPARIKTSIEIDNVKQWANGGPGRWIKSHPRKDTLNLQLDTELQEIRNFSRSLHEQDIQSDGGGLLTPKELADRKKGHKGDDYYAALEACMERGKRTREPSTIANWQIAVNLLKGFVGPKLLITDVTTSLIGRFQIHLQGTKSQRGTLYAVGTINNTISALAAMHEDILMQSGISRKQAKKQSPFSNIDALANSQAGRKLKLQEGQIEAIRAADLKQRRADALPVQDAFSVWLLSYFLGGMRVSDVVLLKYEDFELDSAGKPVRVSYLQYKTDNHVTTDIMAEAGELLARWWKNKAKPEAYVLPFLSTKEAFAPYGRDTIRNAPFEVRRRLSYAITAATRRINTALKLINPALTMHTARHSVADLARRIMESGGDVALTDIQKMLGHTDMKNTKTYLAKVAGRDTSKTLKTLFGKK